MAAAFYLALGAWAYLAPRSFAERVAQYPPYNEHLLRDGGAFQIGLGVAALAALLLSDTMAAVLAGVAAGSVMHAVSHLVDGHHNDPWTIGAFALVTLLGFVAAYAAQRPNRHGRDRESGRCRLEPGTDQRPTSDAAGPSRIRGR